MKCAEENCKKNAYYNYAGMTRKYCREHRKDGMISVVRKKCKIEGCLSYGIYGIEKAEYCKEHKNDTMLNKSVKLCEDPSCVKQASYGKGNESRKYCSEHKKDGMIDVVSSRCSYDGCNKVKPAYGIEGSVERYCSEHKKAGMIKIIKGANCEGEGCSSAPIYNIKGLPAKYCSKHREKHMINVVSRRCDASGCEIYASFDISGGSGKYCATHKKDGMINIKSTSKKSTAEKCISCSLVMNVNKKGYCIYCNPSARQGPLLLKQNALIEYLDARGLESTYTDSLIENGKYGKERPDRVYKMKDKVVILECDENQHKDRERMCENIRMMNIAQWFDGTPVYFIRWNPDNYKCIDGSQERIGMRHKRVGDMIEAIQENKMDLPNALASVIYMYYDDWKGYDMISWEVLQEYERGA